MGANANIRWCATDNSLSYRNDGKYGDCGRFCGEFREKSN